MNYKRVTRLLFSAKHAISNGILGFMFPMIKAIQRTDGRVVVAIVPQTCNIPDLEYARPVRQWTGFCGLRARLVRRAELAQNAERS